METHGQFSATFLAIVLATSVCADDVAAIAAYRAGQSRKGLATFEAAIRQTPPSGYAPFEQSLLAVLESDTSTLDSKRFSCRHLATVGSDAAVPALARTLADPALADFARMALERIGTNAATECLRSQLAHTAGMPLIGVINSLAALREPRAIPALAEIAARGDADVAEAALDGLVAIGTPEALRALEQTTFPQRLQPSIHRARFACAWRLLDDGRGDTARALFEEFAADVNPEHVQGAAVLGLTRVRGAAAVPSILRLLNTETTVLRNAAPKCVHELPAGADITRTLSAALPSLPGTSQVLLVTALAQRGDNAAEPGLIALTRSPDAGVRNAAFRALGTLGGPASAQAALKAAAAGSDMASACLARIPDPAVTDIVLRGVLQCQNPDGAQRLIRVLVDRHSAGSTPALLEVASAHDAATARDAYRAVGKLAQHTDADALLAAIPDAHARDAAQHLEDAIVSLATRTSSGEACTRAVLAGIDTESIPDYSSRLRIAGRLGMGEALPSIVGATASKNTTVRDTAIRALAAWPDTAPADALFTLARSTEDIVHHVLCLRGYLRMAEITAREDGDRALAMCDASLHIVRRDDERKLVADTRARLLGRTGK